MARLETSLAGVASSAPIALSAVTPIPPEPAPLAAAAAVTEEELEFEVGQNWFALAGVAVLTLGAASLLTLPLVGVAPVVPPLAGLGMVAVLFAVSHWWRRSLVVLSSAVRGAAMALLFGSALRLCFPVANALLDIDSWAARLILALVVAANLVIAHRRRSPWLTGLALALGALAVSLVTPAWWALAGLVGLGAWASQVSLKGKWPALALAVVAGGFVAYLAWALGPMLRGGGWHFVKTASWAPMIELMLVMIFAAGAWLRRSEEHDAAWETAHALVNCALGYGIFLVHTLAAFPANLAVDHGAAFVVFLGLAAAFWLRWQSPGATFLYAMTGYGALSIAILKLADAPAVFVWLSLQSVLVVATAIWFRSRLIVVANFFIYVAMVLAYVVLAKSETGISVGFGVVALVSARILNWQKSRLDLKTELMRNAYLVSAFFVLPYALYHLVPVSYAALTWVGLAACYYAMSVWGRNQKYRWMGHATLGLTTIYLVVVSLGRSDPGNRVVSFLVLGAVLLIVSLSFTRARRKKEQH